MLAGMAVAIIAVAQLTDPGSVLELLGLAPALAIFALRGLVARLPAELFAAATVLSVVVVVGNEGHLEGSFFLIVNAVLFTAWCLGSLSRALLILVVCFATPWVVAEVLAQGSGIGWEAWSAASLFTFTLGRILRQQGALIDELEQARRALAEQAVAEERRRIARELHDLAGHTLAAVLLHVTGARHVLRRDLDEAETALLDAEAVGRASLDQIRATVAALRTDERGTDPALAGSADLDDLVEEYRRAGIAIDSDIAPAASRLEGPVGTAVHRIAREALANVARHAPVNQVTLTVQLHGHAVHLLVVDRGRPAGPADAGDGHFGLVGMTERARALGGDLAAEPTSDGWRVSARLPLAMPDDRLLRS